jgi:DNA repair protein RecN (Recombination protein N)
MVEQERAVGQLHAELATAADALADRRQAAAARLAGQVERELRALGMERATFQVAVERVGLDGVTERGLDRVEFRLSTNPGEEVKPLARVASGGELSRTMLALTAVLSRADRVPTMIFDEVDAGIGGRVAAVVSQKLAAAAEGRQVLCVTHLAPIAAGAHHHLHLEKTVRAGRTRVAAGAVAGEARVREIARMLGGGTATETALGHARELLGGPRPRRG